MNRDDGLPSIRNQGTLPIMIGVIVAFLVLCLAVMVVEELGLTGCLAMTVVMMVVASCSVAVMR